MIWRSTSMYKILVIEDDRALEKVIGEFLNRYDFNVSYITDFKNIEHQIEQRQADLILLDINLPYLDGFYVCRSIRKYSTVPIIIISARSGETEQIMGMELGADDYIIKPFSTEVLLAKVRASLRRAYGEYNQHPSSLIDSDLDLILDKAHMKLHYKDHEVELTKNEYKLLELFFAKKNEVVEREEILMQLWDDIAFVDDNTLTVNVTRVKQKLEQVGLRDVIKTKRGVGYYFDTSKVSRDFHG